MPMTKYFEVRDRATFIPVVAVKMASPIVAEALLITAAGYEPSYGTIVLVRLDTCEGHNNSYDWGGRTMQHAHAYLDQYFDRLGTGSVVDVEFILNESSEVRESQAHLFGRPEIIQTLHAIKGGSNT